MGGGAEKKKTNQMLDETYRNSQKDYNDILGMANKQYGVSSDRSDQTFKSLYGGAESLWNDPYGGYDVSGINDAIGRLRGQLGSVDVNAMRKSEGLYREFMDTGGYSEKDISNIRSRGTAGIPAMYARMRDEAARLGAVQGGAGPGRVAMMARMGRDQARSVADASLNTELGIKENVNRGRQWGGESMTGMERGVAEAIARQNAINAQIEEAAGRMEEAKAGNVNANKFKSLDIMSQLYGGENASKQAALQARLGNRGVFDTQANLISSRFANNKSTWAAKLKAAALVAGGVGLTVATGGAAAPIGIGMAAHGVGSWE